jgi:hypothetical protein
VSRQRYPVGTLFKPLGKNQSVCTVCDFLTTRNLAGEIVAEVYVSTHLFLGQEVKNYSVAAATIARGLISIPAEVAK